MKRALFAFLAVVVLCAGCRKHVLLPEIPCENPSEITDENPIEDQSEEQAENPMENQSEDQTENPDENSSEPLVVYQIAPSSIFIDGETYEFKSGFYFGTAGNADEGVKSYYVLLASEELTLSELCDIMEDYGSLENNFVMAALTIFTGVPEEMEEDIAEQFSGEPVGTVTLIKADGTGKELYVFYEDIQVSKAGDDFSITFTGNVGISYTEDGVEEYEAALSGKWEGTMEWEDMSIQLFR